MWKDIHCTDYFKGLYPLSILVSSTSHIWDEEKYPQWVKEGILSLMQHFHYTAYYRLTETEESLTFGVERVLSECKNRWWHIEIKSTYMTVDFSNDPRKESKVKNFPFDEESFRFVIKNIIEDPTKDTWDIPPLFSL